MSFLLMGFDVISALIVTGTVALIIIDMLGMMAFVGISLNAVSLVNLVMVSRSCMWHYKLSGVYVVCRIPR